MKEKFVILFLSLILILKLNAANESANSTWQSALVTVDTAGKLNYNADPQGYYIPDFSAAGYRGGGVPIPDVPVKKTITALAGDNTSHIQSAIDEVGRMSLINGVRGAVLLKAGKYNISGSIYIKHEGVVLRGEGQGDNPASSTILHATGNTPNQRTFIYVGTNSSTNDWKTKIIPSNFNVIDDYVPAHAKTLKLQYIPPYLVVGRQIVVQHDDTQAWLNAIGGGVGSSGAAPWTLSDDLYIALNRYVVAVDAANNTITLDAPVFYGLRKSYSQPYIYLMSNVNIIKEVGIENLRIDCDYNPSVTKSHSAIGSYQADENHAWDGIRFTSAENAWARNVTVRHFGGNGFIVTKTTRSTILNCSVIDPVSIIDGERRYAFNTANLCQLILFDNCYARDSRHGFISNGTSTASGNVFLNCRSENAFASSEGHRKWSSGFLFDNYKEVAYNGAESTTLAFHNRGTYGTSHGWGMVTGVAWNCDLTAGDPAKGHLVVQMPPTGQNFAIGTKAKTVDNKGPFAGPVGFIEGTNRSWALQPSSLYHAQLENRMSVNTITHSVTANEQLKDYYKFMNQGIPVVINIRNNEFMTDQHYFYVYNSTGQIVEKLELTSDRLVIDLSKRPFGIYIGRIGKY